MPARIRAATAADLETVTALRREYCPLDGVVFDPERNRAALTRLLGDPGLGRLWVAEDGTLAAGYVCLCTGFSLEFGRDAFVDELYVRERQRHRGLGRALLETAIAACSGMNVEALHLLVAPGNVRARGLYERRGFAEEDRRVLTLWIAPRPVAER
ncbi:MAG: GNAT family N-acetyltransferase [SAR324 cluster bacterium]